MHFVSKLLAVATAMGFVVAAYAQVPEPAGGRVGAYPEGDLPLESGQVIKDFSLSYETYGTLNAAKSNAILMVTAIGGNHHRLDYLIGPGKALDTNRYFIITTDAIGNGLSTSPSNSTAQPGMAFPRFVIRDMVESQYRLVTAKFGIEHLFAVVGASMGGMQTLQWGVSHPGMMDALVPIVPLGRTPPWTKTVLELTRQEIMGDPAWDGGNYRQPPEKGMRMWAGTMALITRTPELMKNTVTNSDDAAPWLRKTEDSAWKNFDARNWIYQTWAYDAHDLGTTPGFGGDYYKALRSIRARMLVLAGVGDLLNPEPEALEVASYVHGAQFESIEPRWPSGHFSAAGTTQPEVDFQNREIGTFLTKIAAEKHIE
ncbi:Homoserine O-acetyltransferase [Caballeronia glathei]|uniref:Alpha/beta hydrolase n=1 Tax=Caballeronia glathei TaxID=60547 RepID=A0A069PV38_9BURK|nr:alpha/beta fold hydrolase [Caballeronia glathei]KDR44327.1 alpha/beta hydrolase [Caballeronia glathei]CDY77615.1 Homoserine O-acetyltransferase [Caballeronia glathei]